MGKSMTSLARLIGSFVCRVLDPITSACSYPDGLVLLGSAASVTTLVIVVIIWAVATDYRSAG
jgi:hypothetical protein